MSEYELKYRACGHYIVVILDKADEDETYGDSVILKVQNTAEKNRIQQGSAFATVLDVGCNAFAGFEDMEGNQHQWVEAGDKVMIANHAGQSDPFDDSLDPEQQKVHSRVKTIVDKDILRVLR